MITGLLAKTTLEAICKLAVPLRRRSRPRATRVKQEWSIRLDTIESRFR